MIIVGIIVYLMFGFIVVGIIPDEHPTIWHVLITIIIWPAIVCIAIGMAIKEGKI